MAKFEVEVGGFVTVFRQRKLIVFAKDEDEASRKAADKFVDLQSKSGDCDEGHVDSVQRIG